MRLEEDFDVEISSDRCEKVRTVQELHDMILPLLYPQ